MKAFPISLKHVPHIVLASFIPSAYLDYEAVETYFFILRAKNKGSWNFMIIIKRHVERKTTANTS